MEAQGTRGKLTEQSGRRLVDGRRLRGGAPGGRKPGRMEPVIHASEPATIAGPAASEFRASRGLLYVGGFFAYGLGLSALYATTGIGVPCLFRAVTGWSCPFCGGTRMGSALLRGDLVSAFWLNPLALVGIALVGVLGVLWTVEVLGGPAVRLPRASAARLRQVRPTHWLLVGLLVAAVYTVVRNL